MADVPLGQWFSFVKQYLSATAAKPLADLFSGPGFMAAAARAAGFQTVAVDRHLPFLKNQTGAVCADVLNLPFADAAFSALTATNASLNYLADAGALRHHLAECYRVLDAGGVYVFDVCPPERAVALTTRVFQAENGISFLHSYQSALKLLTTTVAKTQGDLWQENHQQYIFSPEEIRHASESTGFRIKTCTPNYGLPTAGIEYPVMTYVLYKSEAAEPKQ